jgi:hypothetical protein
MGMYFCLLTDAMATSTEATRYRGQGTPLLPCFASISRCFSRFTHSGSSSGLVDVLCNAKRKLSEACQDNLFPEARECADDSCFAWTDVAHILQLYGTPVWSLMHDQSQLPGTAGALLGSPEMMGWDHLPHKR